MDNLYLIWQLYSCLIPISSLSDPFWILSVFWGLRKALGKRGLQKKKLLLGKIHIGASRISGVFGAVPCITCPGTEITVWTQMHRLGFFPPPYPSNIMKIKMLWMNWKRMLFKGRLPEACKFFPHQMRHIYDFILSFFLLTIQLVYEIQ